MDKMQMNIFSLGVSDPGKRIYAEGELWQKLR